MRVSPAPSNCNLQLRTGFFVDPQQRGSSRGLTKSRQIVHNRVRVFEWWGFCVNGSTSQPGMLPRHIFSLRSTTPNHSQDPQPVTDAANLSGDRM